MGDINRINVNVLNQKRINFIHEKNNFEVTTYATFKSSYLSNCFNGIIKKMGQNLETKYQKIQNLYQSIDSFFSSYLNDIGQVEQSLSNFGRSGSITKSAVRGMIDRLPNLENYDIKLHHFVFQNVQTNITNKSITLNAEESTYLKTGTMLATNMLSSIMSAKNSEKTLGNFFKNTVVVACEGVSTLWSKGLEKINHVIERDDIPINDAEYIEALQEYEDTYDTDIKVIELYIAAAEEELAQRQINVQAEYDQWNNFNTQGIASFNGHDFGYKMTGDYNEFQGILNRQQDAIKNPGKKVDEMIAEKGFDSVTEYNNYITELNNAITYYKYAVAQLEQSKAFAKYDCIDVLEDYQNYTYESPNIKDNIKYGISANGISYTTYEEYCAKYGDVSEIDYMKALREKVYLVDLSNLFDGDKYNFIKAIEETNQYNFIEASQLNPELEKKYHYLYERYGKEIAEQYVKDCEGIVNNILGKRNAENFLANLSTEEEVMNAVSNHLQTTGKGLLDGVVSFGEGVVHTTEAVTAFFTDYNPSREYTVHEYETMYILTALQEKKYSGALLSNNYEISQGIGNMAPSIALSALNPVVGATALGVSSGGNAYHGALVDGYSNAQALLYGVLTGSTEAITERLLGGIPGLSDVKAVDFKTWVQSMAKEAGEEGFQTFLDTVIVRQTVFGEKVNVDELMQEMIKSAGYGGITAGILQSPSAIINHRNINAINNSLKNGIITDTEIMTNLKEIQSQYPNMKIELEGKTLQNLIHEYPELISKMVKNKMNFTNNQSLKTNQESGTVEGMYHIPEKYSSAKDLYSKQGQKQQIIQELIIEQDDIYRSMQNRIPEQTGKILQSLFENPKSDLLIHRTDYSQQQIENRMFEVGVPVRGTDYTYHFSKYKHFPTILQNIEACNEYKNAQGCLLVQIPKDNQLPLYYKGRSLYNNSSQMYLLPEYIVGWVEVNNGQVGNIIFNPNYLETHNYSPDGLYYDEILNKQQYNMQWEQIRNGGMKEKIITDIKEIQHKDFQIEDTQALSGESDIRNTNKPNLSKVEKKLQDQKSLFEKVNQAFEPTKEYSDYLVMKQVYNVLEQLNSSKDIYNHKIVDNFVNLIQEDDGILDFIKVDDPYGTAFSHINEYTESSHLHSIYFKGQINDVDIITAHEFGHLLFLMVSPELPIEYQTVKENAIVEISKNDSTFKSFLDDAIQYSKNLHEKANQEVQKYIQEHQEEVHEKIIETTEDYSKLIELARNVYLEEESIKRLTDDYNAGNIEKLVSGVTNFYQWLWEDEQYAILKNNDHQMQLIDMITGVVDSIYEGNNPYREIYIEGALRGHYDNYFGKDLTRGFNEQFADYTAMRNYADVYTAAQEYLKNLIGTEWFDMMESKYQNIADKMENISKDLLAESNLQLKINQYNDLQKSSMNGNISQEAKKIYQEIKSEINDIPEEANAPISLESQKEDLIVTMRLDGTVTLDITSAVDSDFINTEPLKLLEKQIEMILKDSRRKHIIEVEYLNEEILSKLSILKKTENVDIKIKGVGTYNLQRITNTLEQNVNNLKSEVLNTLNNIKNKNNILTIARKLYIELNKRLQYNIDYMNMNDGTSEQFLENARHFVTSFDNLENNQVICKGWAELYKELLIAAGIPEDYVSIVSTSKNDHWWVEINDGKQLISADATDAINGEIDLINVKGGLATSGFLLLQPSNSGIRPDTIVEYEPNAKYVEWNNEQLKKIDQAIHYAVKGGYYNETLNKTNRLFGKSGLAERLLGTNSLENRINKLFNIKVPENMNGYESWGYFRKILPIIMGENQTRIINNLDTHIPNPLGGEISRQTMMCLDENNNVLKTFVYDELNGVKIFDNYDDYLIFLNGR